MSNYNKTETNRQYEEAIRKSVSNVIGNTAGGVTASYFNDITSTGTNINHIYTNKTITTGDDFKLDFTLMDVGTQPNRNYRYYNGDVFNYKEMVTPMNSMMKIKDVEIVVPNKVVKVTFEDNTNEKAVCHEDDQFSLETAIIICMTKHLLGSSKFNNILAKGVKIVENKVKAVEEAEKEKARIEYKRLKNHNKRVERRKRKEAEACKARIQETAEAITLANEMMKNEANNKED